jgi:hypothetical protein
MYGASAMYQYIEASTAESAGIPGYSPATHHKKNPG